MLLQLDLDVRDVLQQTIREVRDRLELLEEPFGGRPLEERDELTAYFAGYEVPVRLGFPRNPAEVPGYFVVLGGRRETGQVVGSAFPDEEPPNVLGDDNVAREVRGSLFDGLVRVACWSANAALTVWLEELATWGLMRARPALAARGYTQQLLAAGDIEPMPPWYPDFAFRRDVTLAATYPVSVTTLIPKVRGVTVSATGTGDTTPTVISTRR